MQLMPVRLNALHRFLSITLWVPIVAMLGVLNQLMTGIPTTNESTTMLILCFLTDLICTVYIYRQAQRQAVSVRDHKSIIQATTGLPGEPRYLNILARYNLYGGRVLDAEELIIMQAEANAIVKKYNLPPAFCILDNRE